MVTHVQKYSVDWVSDSFEVGSFRFVSAFVNVQYLEHLTVLSTMEWRDAINRHCHEQQDRHCHEQQVATDRGVVELSSGHKQAIPVG